MRVKKMANTTTTQVTTAVNNFLDRTLLTRAYPHFVHALWAQVKDIPKNNSPVIKFRKYTSLSAATTALTEGVTPTGSSLSITDITATVKCNAVVKSSLIFQFPFQFMFAL